MMSASSSRRSTCSSPTRRINAARSSTVVPFDQVRKASSAAAIAASRSASLMVS
jgi:hypothetical protein